MQRVLHVIEEPKAANEQHMLNMCSHVIRSWKNLMCSAQINVHIIFPGKLKMCYARKNF